MKRITIKKPNPYAAVALIAGLCMANQLHAEDPFPAFPPDDVNRTIDRDQMMWQLDMTFPELPSKLVDLYNNSPRFYPEDPENPEGNWTRDEGDFVARTGYGLWTNYDDTEEGYFPGPNANLLGDYTPINLFEMNVEGRPWHCWFGSNWGRWHRKPHRIHTPTEWWTKRRPEIAADAQRELYGFLPEESPEVTFEVVENIVTDADIPYREKIITGIIDTSAYPDLKNAPTISAILRTPLDAEGPVPAIINIDWGLFGPAFSDAWWGHTAPEGWGSCTISVNSLQPDFVFDFSNGFQLKTGGDFMNSYLIGLLNEGNWRQPDDMGAIMAWTWGISRLVDYFETDEHVDASRLGVTGHSRFGKTALVAMAFEPRLAIAYPSCSGSLGAKPARRHWGQDLEHSVWDQEYHWMAGNFMKYQGELIPGSYLPRKVELLPVDAHSILALCAPRPVFINGGDDDRWTDPWGMYLTTRDASPVYEFLGFPGVVVDDEKPQIETAYIDGNIGYRYHDGGHTDQLDAPAFIEFARGFFDNNLPVVTADQSFDVKPGILKYAGRVEATDADGEPVSNWQIIGGTGAAFFHLDRETGNLWSVWPPVGKHGRSFTLEVAASDGRGMSKTVEIEINVNPKKPNKHKKVFSLLKFLFG